MCLILQAIAYIAAKVFWFKSLQNVSFVQDMLDLLLSADVRFGEALQGKVFSPSLIPYKLDCSETTLA